MRRSTCKPAGGEDARLGRALAEDPLDLRETSRTPPRPRRPALESFSEQIRSTSPIVSRRRRRLPAISACFTCFSSRSRSTSASAIGSASPMPIRPAACERSSMPCLIASIFFSPMPLASSAPSSMALTRSSRLVMPRSFQSSAIVLGPSPGISQQRQQPRRHARGQLVEVGAAAGLDVLLDDLAAATRRALRCRRACPPAHTCGCRRSCR